MFTWKRLFIAVGVFALLTLAFITMILPGMIVERAERWVADEMGRKLAIESLTINPFGLTVEIQNLSLSDTDHDKAFVSWDLMRASLSTASIFKRAPVIDELTLENPRIRLERLAEKTFNFSDLIPQTSETPEQDRTETEPARFSINNINISGGAVDLLDQSLADPIHHKISNLQLVLPSVGNLPYMVENPAQPIFKAEINDSPIDIEGNLKPFSTTQEMTFEVEFNNYDIPFYLDYIPVELPVDIRNGKLNLDLDILYRYSEETGNELILSGKASLAALNIWDKQQERLFFLPLLQVELAPSQPLRQNIHLSALRIYNLEVELNRNQAGEWNHARMAQSPPGKEPDIDEGESEPTEPFKLLIDTIEIRDGVVNFTDQLPAGSFSTVAKEININVNGFSLDATEGIPFSLGLETERDETATASGTFTLQPFSLSLQTELSALQLAAYQPYYQDFYSLPLGGSLSAQAGIIVTPEEPFKLHNGYLSLRDLKVEFNQDDAVKVGQLDLEGITYSLEENHFELASLTSADAHAAFSRADDGAWSFLSENFPVLHEETSAESDAQPEQAGQQAAQEFSYLVGNVDINDWQIDFTDNQPEQEAQIKIDDLKISASTLSAPESNRSPFSIDMKVQNSGRIKIDGTTSLTDFATTASTRLQRLPLASLAPYVAEQTNLVLADGVFDAQLETSVTPQGEALTGGYSGKVGISRMHLLDRLHKEDLVKWDSLQVAGIKGEMKPFSLAIESVTLSDYFAKVLIDEEARLNLVEAFRKPGEGEANSEEENAAQPEEPGPDATDEDSVRPEITISKVVLQGGHVDFTDKNLPQTFHADMQQLGGRIDGLSSSPEARANVDLRGNLRSQSPLNITGTVNPLAEDIFLDIELNFRDIEMSPFSPYSGNFVGYMIEKGKLNLALDYNIEDHQLKASNKVFLDQFSFGEAVESENAINLPVKLAVALLKDGNGEIHLDIPVSGSLDDPKFSIAGVVWRVIRNLLVKAATSPFALLGAIIGGGDEDFSSVGFDYGSQRLLATEQDKLKRMGEALLDRPSLIVEISGYIDPEEDPEGYRKEQLAQKIKRLKFLDLLESGELPEGVEQEDVTVPAEEYADYLWEVYKEADFPKPRNFIGMTQKLPEAEMEKLIYTNTTVSDDQLRQLAQARALAVQNFLTEQAQLPKERVFLKKPDITTEPDNETQTRARVELDASVK